MLPFDKQCFIYAIGYKDDKKNYTCMYMLSKNKYI